MFPLGDSTKTQVRAEAARRGLAVAEKPDSHDICFIADGDTASFLRRELGSRPGPVVDSVTGEVVGEHDGAYAYTVGQRRGLKLGRPAADGKPRYVLDIQPVSGTVTVGPAEALDAYLVDGDRPVWTDGVARTGELRCAVQVRAHGTRVAAVVTVSGGGVTARLDTPVRGVAAGQALVLYDGDRVLGSATITAARPLPAAVPLTEVTA
jgi:tRNA-specific 2-thiouridylase